jgi:glycosyltransferase involved in cell wall biosynthesis
MLFSLFTPTNNVQYLAECYASLREQTYDNWEWVIAPNGESPGEIPGDVLADRRVKVHEYTKEPNIGALKRFCCEKATGDVYVEFDHDDLLLPSCLQNVKDTLERTRAGFVYSDTACFTVVDGKKVANGGYDGRYGWSTYAVPTKWGEFTANRCFEINARSLCEIGFAPDHVRCWTKNAYWKAGGHDETLLVGDDHDLICRTYLRQIKFATTGTCEYLYRTHPDNTVKKRNREIQEQQANNRDRYIHKLIDEWLRRKKLRYLDVQRDEDFVQYDNDGQLVLSVEDNTVGAIRAFDLLHKLDLSQAKPFMDECYRVLAPGGWLCLAVPSAVGPGGYLPISKSFWSEASFRFWAEKHLAEQLGPIVSRYQQVRCFTAKVANREIKNVPYVYADLCAIKGQRQPGRVLI